MTRNNLKQYIADLLGRSDMEKHINNFIELALVTLESNPKNNFKYMETTQTMTLGSSYLLSFPSNAPFYKSSISLTLTDPDTSEKLYPTKDSLTNLWKLNPSNPATNLGQPTIFAYNPEDGKLVVQPTPVKTYTYSFKYYGRTTISDTHHLVVNHPHILIYGALVESRPMIIDDDLLMSRLQTWATLLSGYVDMLRATETVETYSGVYMRVGANHKGV